MLIDLHAHAPHPDYYDQHPYWGPAFELSGDRTALGGMGKEKGEEDRIE